jgi:hypothetical protein
MAQINWGPVPITYGRKAFVTAEFFDVNGNTTVPAGATLTVTYVNITNASQTDITTLTPTGSFFTGTWSSTSASYGLADWNVAATGGSTAGQTGQFRIIYP